MTGDEKARHCQHCSKNVYNLESMTNEEAINLINDNEGEVCIRLFRRPDGTVVTAECPPVKNYRDPKNFLQFSMASLMLLVMGCAGLFASAPWIGEKLRPIYDSWFGPADIGQFEMGDIVAPAANLPANPPKVRALMGKIRVDY